MLSAMPLKFFIVPVLDAAPAEAEINAFLARHRVVAIDRRWVDQGSSSLWAICVDYSRQAAAAPWTTSCSGATIRKT